MTWREGDEKPVVQRLASSSLVMPGMQVWNDATAQQVFGQLRRVATAWIEARNISFKPEHAVNSVALDFELREMDGSWPVSASGGGENSRGRSNLLATNLVIKQVRSLEPATPHAATVLADKPIPRDVLARIKRAVLWTCKLGSTGERDHPTFEIRALEVQSDENRAPDLGFGELGLVAEFELLAQHKVASLGIEAGFKLHSTHLDFAGGWRGPGAMEVEWHRAAQEEWTSATLDLRGDGWEISNSVGDAAGDWLHCEPTTLFASPEENLAEALAQAVGRIWQP